MKILSLQVKFYPYENRRGGGIEQVLTMLKGGGRKCFGVAFLWKFEVLAMLKRGTTSFHPLKGGARKRF